ncbi:type II toxin-antitoxin system Phd/YefM family antitoxin [Pseudonocardia nigra]|uniref:type II toxin-antitoxin system Phd/YefM family antitoxin n=1 Tax=Pseudonocardia nigra TaxID=1921578 RepID=UPI001C5D9742|nr:type II toxin-antitoxin system prevent-host-death family antitoxin [Pseudonocardia nigra]
MSRLSVSEARAGLPEVLDRVARGEEITITRHGTPVAVVLRPDAVRVRRAEQTIDRAREIGAMLTAAREQPLAPAELAVDRAEDLVQAVRTDRDRS